MAKVGVLGARGRMGREVVHTVSEAPDLEVVAEVDQGDALDALTGCDVVVDFTHPGVVMSNLHWCVLHDLDVVVGTSGFAEDRLDEVRGWLPEHPGVRVLVVPNFSVGAILMMRFAAQAARFFPSAEVIELHHGNKADAPSGTALRTASMIAAARAGAGLGPPPDATATALPGARGASVDGVHGAGGGAGGAPGGAVRRDRGDADDPARFAGPGLVHAGSAARRPRPGHPPARPHRRPGGTARPGQRLTRGDDPPDPPQAQVPSRACAEASGHAPP
jgi:4-hydroxy-tetrahydrodipicolinate reductase